MNEVRSIVVEDIRTQTARLPAAYEAAKVALARCTNIDECQTWANKAQALASYARQADDDTLQKQAMRIQSRAIRRCGELLQEFRSAGGRPAQIGEGDRAGSNDDAPEKTPVGDLPSSATEAARAAGISEHQHKTAIRVANVPSDLFEAAVDSDEPPTVTTLADMGKKQSDRPIQTSTRPAIVLMGFVRRLSEFGQVYDPGSVAAGVEDFNRKEMRRYIAQCRRWLKEIAPKLRDSDDGI